MGTKAIFVDGASLFHMGRVLGIGEFKFQALYDFLVNEVGECRNLFGRPFYVLSAEILDRKTKALSRAGFEGVNADTKNSLDDKFIIRKLREIDSNQVEEIVLVSADADYHSSLADKNGQGIRIYRVATKLPDPRHNRPMINMEIAEAFNFIELNDFKEKIMARAWRDASGDDSVLSSSKAENIKHGTSNLTSVNATLKLEAEPATIQRLVKDLSRFVVYDDIKISISINER